MIDTLHRAVTEPAFHPAWEWFYDHWQMDQDEWCATPPKLIDAHRSFFSTRTLYARATDQLIPPAPVFTDPGIDGLNASVICPHGLADCPESHAIFRAIPPSRWPRYDV